MHATQARILEYLMRRPRTQRRPIRFSMRTLFVLVTFCGLAAGGFTVFVQSHIREYHREQATLSELQQLGGITDVAKRAHGPSWLKAWRDGEYAYRLDQIAVRGRAASEAALAKLRDFPQLGHLRIENGQEINDAALAQLARHPTLRSLTLVNTPVAATGTQALRQSHLTSLHIVTDDATEYDAAWIGGHAQLRHLSLRAPVTDADLEPLGTLSHLEWLTILSDRVTDAGLAHLAGLSNLQRLNLECPVTDAGMVHLAGLPKLKELVCRPDPHAAQLVDNLNDHVWPVYVVTPLADALNLIGLKINLPIRIDHTAVRESKVALEDVNLTVQMRRLPRVRDALKFMLAPHGLAYMIEPNGLLITTKEEAARMRPGTTRLMEANPEVDASVPW